MKRLVPLCWVLVCCLIAGCEQKSRGQSATGAAKESSPKNPSATSAGSVAANAYSADVELIRWLLNHRPDTDSVGQDDPFLAHRRESRRPQTPLQRAAAEMVRARGKPDEQKWREVVKMYEDRGFEVDILTAIYKNDIERVKTILKMTPAIANDFQSQSPLRTAASLGRLEICRYLIENYEVDLDDLKRGDGHRIIQGALKHPEVVQLLIAHGADLKTRITFRGAQSFIRPRATLLHYAASDGVPETIRLLIDNGVDIFATTPDYDMFGKKEKKQTALEVAAIVGEGDNSEAIVNHPRFDAAEPAVRQALLDECLVVGAAPRSFDRDATRVKLVKVLLEKGASPHAHRDGTTALQMAASAVHPTAVERNAQIQEIVDVLISHGARLDFVSAVALGRAEDVQRMLHIDPTLANSRRYDGYPALHIAVEMNDKAIVQMLLTAGCDVNIRSQGEYTGYREGTALHIAALWGRFEIAQLLIVAGADVNALNSRKSTPLHNAASTERVKLASLLLEHGAKPDAEDKDEKTPLDSYRDPGFKRSKEMEDLFEEYRKRRPN